MLSILTERWKSRIAAAEVTGDGGAEGIGSGYETAVFSCQLSVVGEGRSSLGYRRQVTGDR
jgi:hypothetical protein